MARSATQSALDVHVLLAEEDSASRRPAGVVGHAHRRCERQGGAGAAVAVVAAAEEQEDSTRWPSGAWPSEVLTRHTESWMRPGDRCAGVAERAGALPLVTCQQQRWQSRPKPERGSVQRHQRRRGSDPCSMGKSWHFWSERWPRKECCRATRQGTVGGGVYTARTSALVGMARCGGPARRGKRRLE